MKKVKKKAKKEPKSKKEPKDKKEPKTKKSQKVKYYLFLASCQNKKWDNRF